MKYYLWQTEVMCSLLQGKQGRLGIKGTKGEDGDSGALVGERKMENPDFSVELSSCRRI